MEMTDRRPRIAAAKESSTERKEQILLSTICLVDRPVARNNSPGVVSRTKRIYLILLILSVFTLIYLRFELPILSKSDGVEVTKLSKSADVRTGNTSSFRSSDSDKKKDGSANSSKPKKKAKPTTTTTITSTPDGDKQETSSDETSDDQKQKEKTETKTAGNVNKIKSDGQKSKSEYKSSGKLENSSSSTTTIIKEDKQQEEGTTRNNDEGSSNNDNKQDDDANSPTPSPTNDKKEDTEVTPYTDKPEKKATGDSDAAATTKSHKDDNSIPNTSTTKTADPPLLKLRSDTDLSAVAKKFVETNCDLTNLKDGAWYPSGPEDDWEQRAPYTIVTGVWNAGVNPLASALLKHPQIQAAKQNGFFLPNQFQRYYGIQSGENSMTANNDQTAADSTKSKFNIKVFAARERMYAQVYSKTTLFEKSGVADGDEPSSPSRDDAGKKDEMANKQVAMDVSPGLMFYAHKTAHSILCTAPWVKVVVVLRNPIDRLYRQWAYSITVLGLTLSLEDWMAQEMKLLQTVGLISGGDKEAETGSANEPNEVVSEKKAWEDYQSVRQIAGAIGRSLYVLQLQEWMDAFVSAGKTPSEEIIILTTEDIQENPKREYSKLIQFLGLKPLEADSDTSIASSLEEALLQKAETVPMKKETREMLNKFFKPYNQRLTELLNANGFEGDWYTRWKK